MSSTDKAGFAKGMRDGIPIAMGYFAVAFSLGITARDCGFSPLQGFVASITTYASAGQYIGFTLYAAKATIIQLIIMTIITNARYVLMGFGDLRDHYRPARTDQPLLSFRSIGLRGTVLGSWDRPGDRPREHPSGPNRQRAERRPVRDVPRGDHPCQPQRQDRRSYRGVQFRGQLRGDPCSRDIPAQLRQPDDPSDRGDLRGSSDPVPGRCRKERSGRP